MFYVYILELDNKALYIGFTTNLKNRLNEHNNKRVLSTKKSKYTKLLFYAAFNKKKKALNFEKYLKTSSGFAFRNKRLI